MEHSRFPRIHTVINTDQSEEKDEVSMKILVSVVVIESVRTDSYPEQDK
jgi:hypothetical protein